MNFVWCFLFPLLSLHVQALENAIRSASSDGTHLNSHVTTAGQRKSGDLKGSVKRLSIPADSVKLSTQTVEHAHHVNQPPASGKSSVVLPHPTRTKPHPERILLPVVNGTVNALVTLHMAAADHGQGTPETTSPHLDEAHSHDTTEDSHAGLHQHALAMYVVAPVAFALLVSLILAAVTERLELAWLPESVVTLLVGACLGLYMKDHLSKHEMFTNDEVFSSTCATLITLFLLPVLIFQSGWSLRIRDFASQFEYVLMFAVVGTAISFLSVGCMIYYTGEMGLGWHTVSHARTAFAYASLIAATDPVATLNTYTALKVDPLLNIMVFGDSSFNDAVAIVLFKVLNDDKFMGSAGSRPELGDIILNVAWGIGKLFCLSFVFGVAMALAFLIVLRVTHMRHTPRIEILCLVAHGYLTFAVAEAVGLSGIVATIFCSMLLGIYAREHLSAGGSVMSDFFLKQVAKVMDAAIFLLTGFCICKVGSEGAWFSVFAMLFCLVGRALAVFPIGLLTNHLKTLHGKATGVTSQNKLSMEALFMMWHAGLRGGIALALCMQLGPWVDILDGEGTARVLHTATYLLIIVFLLVFGGSTEAMLHMLKIPCGKDVDPNELFRNESSPREQRIMAFLDEKIMVPFFVGDERMEESHEEKLKEMEIEDCLEYHGLLRRFGRKTESAPRVPGIDLTITGWPGTHTELIEKLQESGILAVEQGPRLGIPSMHFGGARTMTY